jgi:hypothetical protein
MSSLTPYVMPLVVRPACLKFLGSQRFSLIEEGLAYIPKNGMAVFATRKTSFLKENGRFCSKQKQVWHLKQYCKNKNKVISPIKFDSWYLLTKGTDGVKGKFIGATIVGLKKNAAWVTKSLITNLGGPKKVWAPKINWITRPEECIVCLIMDTLNTWLEIKECSIQLIEVAKMNLKALHLVIMAWPRSNDLERL